MATRNDQRATSARHGVLEVEAPPRETTSEANSAQSSSLPDTRRSYVVPLSIAIVVFVILIAVRTFWGMTDGPRITSPTPAETEAPTGTPLPSP